MGSTCTFPKGCDTGYGLTGSTAPRTCQQTGLTIATTNTTMTGLAISTTPLATFTGSGFSCFKCPENAGPAATTSPCRCGPAYWSEVDTITSPSQFCRECPFPSRCLGGSNCSDQFTGVACAACQQGYYTLVSSCFPCPEHPGLEYIAVAMIGIAAVYW